MRVFLLGAGASRGTMNFDRTPVPVSAEFGRALSAIEPAWFSKYPALAQVVAHLRLDPNDWSLEDVWGCLEYYSKLWHHEPRLAALPDPKPWSNESPNLKHALLRVYGKRCDDAADALPADDSYTLGKLLQGVASDDVVVSFNYDTIAERVAAKFGRRFAQVRSANLPNDGRPVLAKPHGSTSWLMKSVDRTVHCATDDGGPRIHSLVPENLAEDEEPLVLGAVPIKSELIREVQGVCAEGLSWIAIFETIVAQWRQVVDALRRANSIVVVGYSFPREDQYGRFLIREALRPRTTRPVIEFFERPEKASERAAEIVRTFAGHVEALHYRGPVEPAS